MNVVIAKRNMFGWKRIALESTPDNMASIQPVPRGTPPPLSGSFESGVSVPCVSDRFARLLVSKSATNFLAACLVN